MRLSVFLFFFVLEAAGASAVAFLLEITVAARVAVVAAFFFL